MHVLLATRPISDSDIVIEFCDGDLWHYWASGIDNIFVRGGLRLHGEGYEGYFQFVEIEKLHELIRCRLLSKNSRLTGPEFRFLRKELRQSRSECAARLGVGETELAEWEERELPERVESFIRDQFRPTRLSA
ncbi:helix-turn-helix domain-containing protein [Azospirillum thermophilum]|uniref:Transcriptional regulator n=1 Tax=Azospirillum thermophilum TaxID=2202148 RepID=A0A2S2CSV2_9PROT|nr:hypothetical protein [Azospirillum thermophilum]AWK87556.1 hypothetical protein DEW08_16210 [Azospirillum thermophilum]